MKHSPKCGKHGVSNDIIVALCYEQEDNNCAVGIINPSLQKTCLFQRIYFEGSLKMVGIAYNFVR